MAFLTIYCSYKRSCHQLLLVLDEKNPLTAKSHETCRNYNPALQAPYYSPLRSHIGLHITHISPFRLHISHLQTLSRTKEQTFSFIYFLFYRPLKCGNQEPRKNQDPSSEYIILRFLLTTVSAVQLKCRSSCHLVRSHRGLAHPAFEVSPRVIDTCGDIFFRISI